MKFDTVLAERKHKVIYRDGDLCAKVFDESFPKSDILNEALNQARVEETGLNIPKIEEVTKIDGKWAIISDYIEGKTLQELMDENPDKLERESRQARRVPQPLCRYPEGYPEQEMSAAQKTQGQDAGQNQPDRPRRDNAL